MGRTGQSAAKTTTASAAVLSRQLTARTQAARLSLMGGDNINTPRASAQVRAGCHRGKAMDLITWWARWYRMGAQSAAQASVKTEYDTVRAAVMRGVRVHGD